MDAYTDAFAAAQALIAAQFATVLQVVWRAIWQFLDAIVLAAWWLGIGRLLRQDHLRLSRLSLALAAVATAGAAANAAGLSLVRDVLLGVLFMLWTGISLLVVFARQITSSFHHFAVQNPPVLPIGRTRLFPRWAGVATPWPGRFQACAWTWRQNASTRAFHSSGISWKG
jgi:hypothetical protein